MYWELKLLFHFKVIADGQTHTQTDKQTHSLKYNSCATASRLS